MKNFVFAGFIEDDWSDEFRTIKLVDGDSSIDLVEKFKEIFDLYESEVGVSYFISDTKKTEIEIKESWLKKISGAITAEKETEDYCFSTWTNGTYYNTYLKIGGHDLFHEFNNYEGKWCIVKVSVKTTES